MFGSVAKTAIDVAGQLHRMFERKGQMLPKEMVAGVECYVAGRLIRPVSAPSVEYLPRSEALTVVQLADDRYHTAGCAHWNDRRRPTFATLIEAIALGLRPCT